MSAKKDLANLLSDDQPTKPVIRRGQGLKLSTDNEQPDPPAEAVQSETQPTKIDVSTPAKSQKRTNEQTQKRTNAKTRNRTNAAAPLRRVNRGYKLREDLIKACKQIALDEDRKLYEVMEEALGQYVAKRRGY